MFSSFDSYKPRPIALLNGGFLSVAVLCAVVVAIDHGGAKSTGFLIGVHQDAPQVVPVDRSSLTASGLNTTVKFDAEPEDPWRAVASVYFAMIRVLRALDADQNFIISPWEMFTAPAALRKLDADGDGKLSPEECGFSLGREPGAPLDSEAIQRARLQFMRGNPVLAALDTNHDGQISASEIMNSAAALKKLDRNGDGSLTPDELIPDKAATQAAMIVLRLDANRDGRISQAERASGQAAPLRELLESADRNRDGATTVEELAEELRFREERKRQFENAVRVAH